MPKRPGIKNFDTAPQSELDEMRDEYLRRLEDPAQQPRQIQKRLVEDRDGQLCYCAQGLLASVLIERGYARIRKPSRAERALNPKIPDMVETKFKGRIYTGSYTLDPNVANHVGIGHHVLHSVAVMNDRGAPFRAVRDYLRDYV